VRKAYDHVSPRSFPLEPLNKTTRPDSVSKAIAWPARAGGELDGAIAIHVFDRES
jgi:hypothetical protein